MDIFRAIFEISDFWDFGESRFQHRFRDFTKDFWSAVRDFRVVSNPSGVSGIAQWLIFGPFHGLLHAAHSHYVRQRIHQELFTSVYWCTLAAGTILWPCGPYMVRGIESHKALCYSSYWRALASIITQYAQPSRSLWYSSVLLTWAVFQSRTACAYTRTGYIVQFIIILLYVHRSHMMKRHACINSEVLNSFTAI